MDRIDRLVRQRRYLLLKLVASSRSRKRVAERKPRQQSRDWLWQMGMWIWEDSTNAIPPSTLRMDWDDDDVGLECVCVIDTSAEDQKERR
jgi:hypothetical protein